MIAKINQTISIDQLNLLIGIEEKFVKDKATTREDKIAQSQSSEILSLLRRKKFFLMKNDNHKRKIALKYHLANKLLKDVEMTLEYNSYNEVQNKLLTEYLTNLQSKLN